MLDPFSLSTRSQIPHDLRSITSIDAASEVAPKKVGMTRAGLRAIWSAVEDFYRSGIHPAIQVCLRRKGEIVLNRAIGHASGNGPEDSADTRKIPATTETPFNIFSGSKAITAMVMHLLDQEGIVHIDDRVCEYIPEFARHGKEGITIRHLLTHRAGIPRIPEEAMDLDNLERPEELLRVMCETEVAWRPGRYLAYHAMSSGFVLAEIVQRATGKSIRNVLRQEICEPLGFRWTNYGVASEDVAKVALSYLTGPPQLPFVPFFMKRVLGVSANDAIALSNDPRFLQATVPSGNIITTAKELTKFYQILLDDGSLNTTRIFEPQTVRRAIAEQSYMEIDYTLALPLRYSSGFMLGGKWLSVYGPDTEHAFGHIGFTNIISWADPERALAASIITSGKPLLYPEIYYAFALLRQIGISCPKVALT